jgi:hypothetical protein
VARRRGIIKLGDVVAQFITATPNVNAANANANAQQIAVVNSMMNYMSNYNIWASGVTAPGGVPFGDASYKTLLNSVQGTMMSAINGLYSSPGNYPTNPSACLQ